MKILILLFALVAVISAAPTSINDNNVGDIVNVGVYANLDVKNKIDYTNISAEIIWKNLQAIILALDRDNDNGIGGGPGPEPIPRITPEMINEFVKKLQN